MCGGTFAIHLSNDASASEPLQWAEYRDRLGVFEG